MNYAEHKFYFISSRSKLCLVLIIFFLSLMIFIQAHSINFLALIPSLLLIIRYLTKGELSVFVCKSQFLEVVVVERER